MTSEKKRLKKQIKLARAYKRKMKKDHRAFRLSLIQKLEAIEPGSANEQAMRDECIVDIERHRLEMRQQHEDFKRRQKAC